MPDPLSLPPSASILVVDDNPANLFALEALLEPLGARIVRANSGQEALDRLARGESFALILLDVQMPGLDGYQTLSLLREQQRATPVILVTAIYKDELNIARGYASGAVDYVTKPLEPDILRGKVSAFLSLHRSTQAIRTVETREHEATISLYAGLLEQASTGIGFWDRELRFVRLNQALADANGLPVDAHLGKRPSEVLPGIDPLIEQTMKRVLAEDRPIAIEVGAATSRTPGERRYWSMKYYPVRAGGEAVGVGVICEDISEQRRREAERSASLSRIETARQALEARASELSNQQKWFEAALDRMPVPLVLVEPGTARLIFSNKMADTARGTSLPASSSANDGAPAVLLGPGGEPVPAPSRPAARAARGEAISGELLDARTPRGDLSLLFESARLPAMAGHPEAIMLAFQDVTALKTAERAAQQAQTRAESANRAKDDFLATVSHELRTPLNAMLGWAQMLRRGLPEEKTRTALEAIERNALSQAQLIEDLLDVSRIVSGQMRLDVQPVDPAAVLESALDSVRPALEAKEIMLEAALDRGLGPWMADPYRLQQVAWNLLSNAAKFTPRGGRVWITLARAGADICIRVSDTGKGMRPEFLPRLFERFQQGDGSITRAHGGLGLGLAIVRNLVELHGGTIEAESPGEGKGATFTVRLPALPRRAPPPGAALRRAGPARAESLVRPPELRGLRVLVVDDEEDARALLVTVLESCGALVTAARSAVEAIGVLHQRSPPDVLLSDISMPGQDGYSLVRAVRSMPLPLGAIPAAAVTAFASADDRRRSIDAGFQMHLAKPVEPAELVAVVATLARLAMK